MTDDKFAAYVRHYLNGVTQEAVTDDEIADAQTAAERYDLRRITAEFDITHTANGILLQPDRIEFRGELIKRVFAEAKGIFAVAVTLSVASDNALRSLSARDMRKAVILNAAFTARVERGLDLLFEARKAELEARGLTLSGRISAGYGDFDFREHARLIRLLAADKYLGISITESGMLIPEKTVTAVAAIKTIEKDNL